MGRQVNFYMLADDLLEFEKILHSKENILLVEARLSAPELQIIDTLVVPEMGKTPLLLYLVREKDIEEVIIKSVAQKYWAIDILRSPVVELMRSYHNESIVRRGRLYFQPGFYDDNNCWMDKSQEFIKWANSLLRWVRQNYKRDSETGFYVGPGAWKWVSERKGELAPI
jgi:hypothetical protein